MKSQWTLQPYETQEHKNNDPTFMSLTYWSQILLFFSTTKNVQSQELSFVSKGCRERKNQIFVRPVISMSSKSLKNSSRKKIILIHFMTHIHTYMSIYIFKGKVLVKSGFRSIYPVSSLPRDQSLPGSTGSHLTVSCSHHSSRRCDPSRHVTSLISLSLLP